MLSEFNERLTILWKESKLDLKGFSKLIDIPYTTVQHWITRGVDPRASSVAMVAKATGVSSDWLLGLTDERS